jgi:hypothetical protein
MCFSELAVKPKLIQVTPFGYNQSNCKVFGNSRYHPLQASESKMSLEAEALPSREESLLGSGLGNS